MILDEQIMVQGQNSKQVFEVKWRLLRLLSIKYFSQHKGLLENLGISLEHSPVVMVS